MDRSLSGIRLRQLRAERRLSQAELARMLDISPSYLNQIEHDTRPLTVSVLVRLSDTLGLDPGFFAPQDVTRTIAELRDVFADANVEQAPPDDEIAEVATKHPAVARSILALHRRYRSLANDLAIATREPAESVSLSPHEEVRDFFANTRNYVDPLDRRAEEFADEIGLNARPKREALVARLEEKHGVRVNFVNGSGSDRNVLSRFDASSRVLRLSPNLAWGQQVFRLAHQLGSLEFASQIAEIVDRSTFHDQQAADLLAIGLTNYVASGMVLPYSIFRDTAEAYRYDIERLSAHFEMGFETTCHRLSTLQRARARGVPFAFVRVDRAGNMSQRQSATAFHFSRAGGTCPLWTVYEAFASPGKLLTQVAEMPDGRRYLWMARTVYRSPQRWGAPGKLFAVGLGCEVRHAKRTVYSTGLNLDDRNAATPIGVGCRVCERQDCPQRAFPPVGHRLDIDPNRGTFIPYPVVAREV
jgi:predicted transcriptional regulator/transcriptional regulator with XRE-family HTH domain